MCPNKPEAESAERSLRKRPDAWIGRRVGRTRIVPERGAYVNGYAHEPIAGGEP